MAKTTVYIPDELWNRVEEHKSRINLSATFQEALKRELAKVSITLTEQVALAEQIPSENLKATIERLSREKDELKQRSYKEGIKAGREWALHEASYEELSTYKENTTLQKYIEELLDERRGEGEVLEYEEFSEGWFEGVEEVWLAIKDRI